MQINHTVSSNIQQIIKPYPLIEGDLIGVYSPSAGFSSKLMENYNRGKRMLINAGYKILEAEHTFEEYSHYSTLPKNKENDFMSLLENSDVKAILPTIGGTTSYQMLPLLDFSKIRTLLSKNPKMIFGFSDNSLQASVLASLCNTITFHGHSDVVFGLGDLANESDLNKFISKGNYTKNYFFSTLNGNYGTGEVKQLTPWKTLKAGNAQGKLIGGNIDVLQILHGSPFEINWDNCIFYWEACYIDLHRVDLILASFVLNGVFNKISGMVIGKSNTLKEEFFTKYDSFEKIIMRHCEEYDFPIIIDADIGHDVECCILPNGCQAKIEDNNLYILENPCS